MEDKKEMRKVVVNQMLEKIRKEKEVTESQLRREISSLFNMASQNRMGNKIMAQVPLYMIALDENYQRTENFSKAKGDQIAANFIEEAYDPIKLNWRDGLLYCPAGQHRIYAHIIMKKDFITAELFKVPYEAEVDIYLSQDDNRSKLAPYDRYKAGLAAKKETSLALQNICSEFDVIILPKMISAPRQLRSITIAEDILKTYGERGLRWILSILAESNWLDEPRALDSRIFRALRNTYRKAILVSVEEVESCKRRIIATFSETTPERFYASSQIKIPTMDAEVAMTRVLADIVRN